MLVINARSAPWRRCVGMMPIHVIPAAGTAAPPGTVTSKVKMLPPPTS
jgi:hypothetical protein